jgi:hypothetical protein
MCLLCIEIKKENLYRQEILKNLREIAEVDLKHAQYIADNYETLILKSPNRKKINPAQEILNDWLTRFAINFICNR